MTLFVLECRSAYARLNVLLIIEEFENINPLTTVGFYFLIYFKIKALTIQKIIDEGGLNCEDDREETFVTVFFKTSSLKKTNDHKISNGPSVTRYFRLFVPGASFTIMHQSAA